jgi:hypothetical protein
MIEFDDELLDRWSAEQLRAARPVGSSERPLTAGQIG